jgi:cell division protein FtsL
MNEEKNDEIFELTKKFWDLDEKIFELTKKFWDLDEKIRESTLKSKIMKILKKTKRILLCY